MKFVEYRENVVQIPFCFVKIFLFDFFDLEIYGFNHERYNLEKNEKAEKKAKEILKYSGPDHRSKIRSL